MSTELFKELLRKYIYRECTPEEMQQIDRWYASLGKDAELDLSPAERHLLKEKLWARIEQKYIQKQPPIQPRLIIVKSPGLISLWTRIAASLILIGIGAFAVFKFRYHSAPAEVRLAFEQDIVTISNHSEQAKKVTLADGSVVSLSQGASIRYNQVFGDEKREVWLKGTAFFEISKDPARPFFVYSGAVMTRVLGTSFWVKTSRPQRQTEVIVFSGKVAVSKQSTLLLPAEPEALVLTPNQKAMFTEDSGVWKKGLIEDPKPVYLAKTIGPPSFEFDAATLVEIGTQISKVYGINIILESENLRNCRFTGDITGQPLYKKIEIICRAIQADYQIQGTDIVIRGNGCTPLGPREIISDTNPLPMK